MTSGFTVDRFKTQLKLAISRLTFLQKKLTSQSLAARKEIADLLKTNKTDQAMTKVRYIVRDDFMVEAMEIVQSFCDDLLKSANLIASTNNCDEFITEQAKSVIYASNRMDVPELLKVRDLLVAKYTKTILPDREIGVYPRLVLKLSMSYPERELCEKYLEAIADNFGVDWSSEIEEESETAGSVDAEEEKLEMLRSLSPANSLGNSVASISSSTTNSHESLPPPPYSDIKPADVKLTDIKTTDVKMSSAPLPMDYSKQSQQQQQQQQQTKQNLPDFDEFTRRFEALRKK